MPVSYCLDDALIMEAVAQQGGYEEVERLQLWEAVASALKLKKAQVPLMKRRYEDMLRVTAEEQEDAAEADGEEEHEVERVVNVRTTHDGKKEYQVKWVGDDELTWEPEANLNCDNLVEQFEEGRSGGNGAPAAKRARAASGGGGGGARRSVREPSGDAASYKEVVAVKKPSATEAMAFLVEHVDGSRSLVSNETLRQDAPQVLLDFYETRVQFGSRADE